MPVRGEEIAGVQRDDSARRIDYVHVKHMNGSGGGGREAQPNFTCLAAAKAGGRGKGKGRHRYRRDRENGGFIRIELHREQLSFSQCFGGAHIVHVKLARQSQDN